MNFEQTIGEEEMLMASSLSPFDLINSNKGLVFSKTYEPTYSKEIYLSKKIQEVKFHETLNLLALLTVCETILLDVLKAQSICVSLGARFSKGSD